MVSGDGVGDVDNAWPMACDIYSLVGGVSAEIRASRLAMAFVMRRCGAQVATMRVFAVISIIAVAILTVASQEGGSLRVGSASCWTPHRPYRPLLLARRNALSRHLRQEMSSERRRQRDCERLGGCVRVLRRRGRRRRLVRWHPEVLDGSRENMERTPTRGSL